MKFFYPLLNRNQIISRINMLSKRGEKFLFIVDFNAESGFVISHSELNSKFVRFLVPGFDYFAKSDKNIQKKNFLWKIFPPEKNDYKEKFGYVQRNIQNGNSFLVNLTQQTKVETDLTIEDIFHISNAKYKLWLNDCFTVFSPEIFVQINDGKISSFPMKGTIDASIKNAQELILNDRKEMAEHATIVDLIRNDLSIMAANVKVERYRYVEKISTNRGKLLHVSSCISGNLNKDYKNNLGDIIFSLLPAGSISGAPKPKTIEIIKNAEGYVRGFYTGVFGWFDGANLDSAVMIRFVERQSERLVFKSGGGITSQSNAESEYSELIQKIYVPVS